MPNVDLLLYGAHIAFWGSLGLGRLLLGGSDGGAATTTSDEPVVHEERTAPYSRALLTFHMVAFGVMYFGIGNAVLPGRVPAWFAGQRVVGTCVIAAGAALAAWALVYFRSWRFRAKLDEGHQLATGGPFRFLRHPIYMGLNLLSLGTAVWVPTPTVWVAFALMVIGSDLRARAEEKLLAQAFGSAYVEYCARTRRFVPGLY